MKNKLHTRFGIIAFLILCSLMISLTATSITPKQLAASKSSVQPKPAPTPLTKEDIVELVEELSASLEEVIDDEDAQEEITEKWEAKIDDLVGKTRKEVIESLFEDVKSVVEDTEKTDKLWASWSSEEGGETSEVKDNENEDETEGALPKRKTSEARLDETLDYIETTNKPDGENGAALLRRRLERMSNKDQKSLSEALSISDNVEALTSNKDEETNRRRAIRGVLLLHFIVKKQQLTSAKTLLAGYAKKPRTDLDREIKSRLPVTDDSPLREFWDPSKFTAPATYKNDKPFKFIVWGMMNFYTGRGTSYKDILANPDIAKTYLISTSVINEKHKSTYYPYGLILKVPKENIISTNSKDQAFKNYKTVTEGLSAAQMTDMLGEIRRVSALYEIKKPDDILSLTSGSGGDSGYNEIVVMGTSPEGKSVEIVGVFMKMKDEKTPYTRQQDKSPFVNDEVQKLIDDLVKKKGIPLVKIIDPKSK